MIDEATSFQYDMNSGIDSLKFEVGLPQCLGAQSQLTTFEVFTIDSSGQSNPVNTDQSLF